MKFWRLPTSWYMFFMWCVTLSSRAILMSVCYDGLDGQKSCGVLVQNHLSKDRNYMRWMILSHFEVLDFWRFKVGQKLQAKGKFLLEKSLM